MDWRAGGREGVRADRRVDGRTGGWAEEAVCR